MDEMHLRVFTTRSELVKPDGTIEVFREGKPSEETGKRYSAIQTALKEGFLANEIIYCQHNQENISFEGLAEEYAKLLDTLIERLTSEAGRALIAVTILQLCVKTIAPEQNIRLHKSMWQDGISMRSLDNTFITPTLRRYNLLSLNADGFMMTRSLAENYPYTSVYKAQLRGARVEWLQIVEGIEQRKIVPVLALRYLLLKLINQAERVTLLATQALQVFNHYLGTHTEMEADEVCKIIVQHIEESTYAARLLEIAMHSLLATLMELNGLGDAAIIPLSQMRSANKKHGNIGDVEIQRDGKIVETWDAKYGKSYLRDEIDEISEKLQGHDAVQVVGFVTNLEPIRHTEVMNRIAETLDLFNVEVVILTFHEWLQLQVKRANDAGISSQRLGQGWLRMYVAYLAGQRRDLAPIDEPTAQWLEGVKTLLQATL